MKRATPKQKPKTEPEIRKSKLKSLETEPQPSKLNQNGKPGFGHPPTNWETGTGTGRRALVTRQVTRKPEPRPKTGYWPPPRQSESRNQARRSQAPVTGQPTRKPELGPEAGYQTLAS